MSTQAPAAPANTATPTAEGLVPKAIDKAKIKVESKFSLAGYRIVKKVRVKDPVTKKGINGPDDKPLFEDKTSSFATVKAVNATQHACESPEGFVRFINQYCAEGAVIPNFFPELLEKFGVIELFEDATHVALTKNATTGEQEVNLDKFLNALYHGVPRGTNTLSTVKTALDQAKMHYGELGLAKDTYTNPTELLAYIQATFDIPSLAAFGIRFTDTQAKIKALRTQLKAMEEAKAARDAEKAKAALAAPAAPKA